MSNVAEAISKALAKERLDEILAERGDTEVIERYGAGVATANQALHDAHDKSVSGDAKTYLAFRHSAMTGSHFVGMSTLTMDHKLRWVASAHIPGPLRRLPFLSRVVEFDDPSAKLDIWTPRFTPTDHAAIVTDVCKQLVYRSPEDLTIWTLGATTQGGRSNSLLFGALECAGLVQQDSPRRGCYDDGTASTSGIVKSELFVRQPITIPTA